MPDLLAPKLLRLALLKAGRRKAVTSGSRARYVSPVGRAQKDKPQRSCYGSHGCESAFFRLPLNSSQSQLAEALARIWAHGAVHAHSAGIAPSRELNPNAIEVMRETCATIDPSLSAHTALP